MASSADYKLKYSIEADGSKATAEIKKVETAYGRLAKSTAGVQAGAKSAASEVSNVVAALTGDRLSGAASQITSLANAFGAIPGPAGLAVGAVASFGVAVVGVGGALFELTKHAAEYGSTIYDASKKTGLHAETLSAMDLAAKQSGTSLEAVTTGIAKLTKNIGAGTDELKAFGITPKQAIADLDGSLAKVFKRINDAKPGYEQITLAQKAFGRSGADLIPFIKEFNGNLPALIAKCKELGLTLGDEDAKQSHEFTAQLAELEQQAQTLGVAFAHDLMPVFKDAMRDLETWLGRNKDTFHEWGQIVSDIIRGVVKDFEDLGKSYSKNNDMGLLMAALQGTGVGQLVSGLAYKGQQERIANAPPAWTGRGFQLNPYTNTLEAQPEKPQAPSGIPDFGKGGGADKFKLSPAGKALVDTANKIGISPLDLATIIGFETAGTYSTSKTNSIGRFGLIQFGKSEAAAYGASKGQSFETQLDAVAKYLVDRFTKSGKELSGAKLLDLYTAVIAGSPTASATRTDQYGTSALSGVRRMLLGGTQQAALARFFGGKESNVPGDKAGTEYRNFEKAANEKAEKDWKEYWQFKKDIQKEGVDYLLTQAERELQIIQDTGAGYVEATQKSKAVADLKLQSYADEITALEELFDHTTDLDKQTEIRRQIEVKTIEMQREKIKITNDESDSIVKLTSKYYDFTEGLKAAQQATEDYMQSMPNGLPPGFKGGVGTGSGAYETEEERQARLGRTIGSGQTRDAFSDLRQHFVDKNSTGMIAGVDAMTQAFSQLGQAVGSAVEAFVLYGNAGASVRQVTAQILASIAQQAAVQAIYELAQGLAVLALAFFGVPNAGPSATAHFAAAAMYGLVAGVTAVAGRGVAGNSMKGGAGGAKGAGAPGSTGAYSYGGTDSINQHPTPYSRASADAYISGHRDPLVAAIDRNTQATLALHKKIDIARPGDVLTRGMDQKPGAVGHQVIKDIGRNAAIGTGMLKAAGQRR